MPAVSVILPVYNSEQYIAEAVQSILDQTFDDFELLVINDASTDRTLEILQAFDDSRLKIINNQVNLKVVKSLNKGLAIARGDYIARMDADDIACPQRFEKQHKYLQAHPEVDLCGTWVEVFGDDNHILWPYEDHDNLKAGLLFLNIIVHPSVMFRKDAFERYGNQYDETFINAEDYGMWCKIIDKMKFANVPEILLKYRYHESNASVLKNSNVRILKEMNFKAYRIFLQRIGIDPSENELELHFDLGFKQLKRVSAHSFKSYIAWLKKIKAANDSSNYINQESLRDVIVHLLILLSKRSVKTPSMVLTMITTFADMYSFDDYKSFIKARSERRAIFKTLPAVGETPF